ncbi:MAG: hypothetical protein GY940_34400, partial [bacterium]|nr:hypothetical protein [bacterium]
MNGKRVYKFYITLFLVVLFGFSTALLAETEEIEKIKKFITKKRVNAGYVMFGASRLELRDMNIYLASHDLPIVGETDISYGLGGHVVHNKFVLGLEIARFSK